jgi:hypothetical protein
VDYPQLTDAEKAIVKQVRATLGVHLLRAKVPDHRWIEVTLACVIDLSGQVLALHEGTPPLEALGELFAETRTKGGG